MRYHELLGCAHPSHKTTLSLITGANSPYGMSLKKIRDSGWMFLDDHLIHHSFVLFVFRRL